LYMVIRESAIRFVPELVSGLWGGCVVILVGGRSSRSSGMGLALRDECERSQT